MAGSNRTALVSVVVVLLAGLILVFFLWQRDQDSKDLEVEVGLAPGGNGAPAHVEGAGAAARLAGLEL